MTQEGAPVAAGTAGRSFGRLTLVLSVLLVMLGALLACPTHAIASRGVGGGYCSMRESEELGAQDWMSGLSDDRLLSEVNIPGTHDTGCADVWSRGLIARFNNDRAITQKLGLREQLDAGVRLFDIRVTDCHEGVRCHSSEDVLLCHGSLKGDFINLMYYCLDEDGDVIALDTVMDTITCFLAAHPTETVITTIKCEYANYKASLTMERIEGTLREYAEFLYTENRMPRLGEVRGKAVVLCDDSNGKLSYGMRFGKTGSGETKVGGMRVCYENNYDENGGGKKKKLTSFYNKHNRRLPLNVQGHDDEGYIVYTSSAKVPGDTPGEAAKEVNQMAFFGDAPLFGERGRKYGWVYSDFVTADTAKMIWESNFPNDLDYCTVRWIKHDLPQDLVWEERVLRGSRIRTPRADLFVDPSNMGWLLGDDVLAPGTEIVVNADLDCTTVVPGSSWAAAHDPAKQRHTVNYLVEDAEGNPREKSCEVGHGHRAQSIAPGIQREGLAVVGWYQDPGFTRPFDFSTPIEQDLTLYGKWGHRHRPVLIGSAEAEGRFIFEAMMESAGDVMPTCTEPGHEMKYLICEDDNEVLEKRVVELPALGHDWGPWTPVEDGSGSHAGLEERICQRCHERETRNVSGGVATIQ